MTFHRRFVALSAAASLAMLAGCSGPGLPPAGPTPGEVDTGYGTEPEEKVTGAVTSISDSGLAGAGGMTLDQLLRGKVAGLQVTPRPEGGYAFRIRGAMSTLQGQAPEPLFIVDGTRIPANQLESALAGLTRDDIRQVDVLKDLASTSVYGMSGAGGVVIITTVRR